MSLDTHSPWLIRDTLSRLVDNVGGMSLTSDMANTEDDDRYAKVLRAEMAYRGITQTQLAERTHISRTTINAYCTGRTVPSLVHLVQIAAALEVPASEIVARAEGTAA